MIPAATIGTALAKANQAGIASFTAQQISAVQSTAKLGLSNGVKAVEFLAEMTNANPVDFYDSANTATAKKDSLQMNPALGLMTGSLLNVALPPVVDPANPPATPYTLYCDNDGMTDLWMAVTWPK